MAWPLPCMWAQSPRVTPVSTQVVGQCRCLETGLWLTRAQSKRREGLIDLVQGTVTRTPRDKHLWEPPCPPWSLEYARELRLG